MLIFVAATNRWLSWSEAVHRYNDTDPINFRLIAAAAPGLPHQRIVEWHAERFIPNYLLGCIAKLLHAALTPTYRVACVVLAIAICLAVAELLERMPIGVLGRLVCLGAFILNPYGLRYYFFSVGRVADLVFILGTVIAVRGLALRAPISLFAGLLLATTARQSAVPAALTAGAVIVADPAWRQRLMSLKLPFAAGVVLIPIVTSLLIRIVVAPFSGPDPTLQAMTILGASSPSALLDHFARCVISLLPVTAMLAAAWWASRRERRVSAGRIEASLAGGDRAASYGCLLFGASIALQPLVLNPRWAAYSEPRLAVLGLAPLVVAFALLLSTLECSRAAMLRAGSAAALLGLLAIGSLHHILTSIGTANQEQTVMLQAVVALSVGAVLLQVLGPDRAGARPRMRSSA